MFLLISGFVESQPVILPIGNGRYLLDIDSGVTTEYDGEDVVNVFTWGNKKYFLDCSEGYWVGKAIYPLLKDSSYFSLGKDMLYVTVGGVCLEIPVKVELNRTVRINSTTLMLTSCFLVFSEKDAKGLYSVELFGAQFSMYTPGFWWGVKDGLFSESKHGLWEVPSGSALKKKNLRVDFVDWTVDGLLPAKLYRVCIPTDSNWETVDFILEVQGLGCFLVLSSWVLDNGCAITNSYLELVILAEDKDRVCFCLQTFQNTFKCVLDRRTGKYDIYYFKDESLYRKDCRLWGMDYLARMELMGGTLQLGLG